jgi:hypothetical protein
MTPFDNHRATFIRRSVEWVRSHPNATNQDVPAELRNGWILPDHPTPEQRQAVLAIFLAGHLELKGVGSAAKLGPDSPASEAEVSNRFETWQLKLIMAKLNATTDARTCPLPLFSLRDDEEVQVLI